MKGLKFARATGGLVKGIDGGRPCMMQSSTVERQRLWGLHRRRVLAATGIGPACGVVGPGLMIVAGNVRQALLGASSPRWATSEPRKRANLRTSRINGLERERTAL